MADSKYGRIFTESDVDRILEWYGTQLAGQPVLPDMDGIIRSMDEEGIRFKFPADEPLFVLRARDRRALGAVRHYLDHQSPRAPQNHIAGVERALSSFEHYRINNENLMKEPD